VAQSLSVKIVVAWLGWITTCVVLSSCSTAPSHPDGLLVSSNTIIDGPADAAATCLQARLAEIKGTPFRRVEGKLSGPYLEFLKEDRVMMRVDFGRSHLSTLSYEIGLFVRVFEPAIQRPREYQDWLVRTFQEVRGAIDQCGGTERPGLGTGAMLSQPHAV
jgi:hypothetical protein